jgi:hypothetical protein
MWYFTGKDKRCGYNYNNLIAKVGRTHKINHKTDLTESGQGLIAFNTIKDALSYTDQTIVWQVELGGKIEVGFDWTKATECTYIAGGIDIEEVLREFARECALSVLGRWRPPSIVVKFLKTGDHSIRDDARAAAQKAGLKAQSRHDYEASDAARCAAHAASDYDAPQIVRCAINAAAESIADKAYIGEGGNELEFHGIKAGAERIQNLRLTQIVLSEIRKNIN